MEHRGLEQESWVSLADEAPAPVADDLVLDLREGTVIDLRGLDAPAWRAEPPLPELAPAADPNDVPLVGSRWVLLVALALLNALDLITTRAVLAGERRSFAVELPADAEEVRREVRAFVAEVESLAARMSLRLEVAR